MIEHHFLTHGCHDQRGRVTSEGRRDRRLYPPDVPFQVALAVRATVGVPVERRLDPAAVGTTDSVQGVRPIVLLGPGWVVDTQGQIGQRHRDQPANRGRAALGGG